MRSAAIYLAHLNPMTRAHESIISTLKRDYNVYVFPVRFIKDDREINTKSFPFTYEVRKSMVESVFGDSVVVLPDYTFYAPYAKYMPPLLSSRSWELRNQIMAQIKEETVLLDANHPLAGQDLIFEIELVEIISGSRIIMP